MQGDENNPGRARSQLVKKLNKAGVKGTPSGYDQRHRQPIYGGGTIPRNHGRFGYRRDTRT